MYSAEGNLLWENDSESNEKAGFVSVSPNGKYYGYADKKGPHICDTQGDILYELSGDENFELGAEDSGCGVDIANDGTFVYTIGSRMYYRRLANE